MGYLALLSFLNSNAAGVYIILVLIYLKGLFFSFLVLVQRNTLKSGLQYR